MSADTIFALSSGRPPAAVGIIRVSGPLAHEAGRRLAGKLPEVREVGLRWLRGTEGQLLDQALVLRFDGPASSTGEDVVEFQCHGGRAVVDAILAELRSFQGLRAAEAGEFTRRAFASGRIDLTEAEGLADLLEAETESQRKAALAMADGGLRRQTEAWRQRVVELSARAEVAIDYVGEEDGSPDPRLKDDCVALAAELEVFLGAPRVERLKDGMRVVVAGPPNAGKSSLINAMAGEERAIVTAVPGTTRDHIEVPLSIAGVPVLLTDTAGLRESADPIERIGVHRAQRLMEAADIIVWMGEPGAAPTRPYVILVHGCADLPERRRAPAGALAVSSLTRTGIRELMERIASLSLSVLPDEGAVALNRRQTTHIAAAHAALQACSEEEDLVLAAELLRSARQAFDKLAGRAGVEDMLDVIFGRFCLGK